MKLRFLFPAKFKRAGVLMAPLGFVVWVLIQKDIIQIEEQGIKTIILATGFFSFLIGLIFLVLSREKTEDEYTQKVRLESYQFAAMFQFFILLSLTILVIFFENRFGKLVFEKMAILLILMFWLVYFIRFNSILYFPKSFRKEYEK
jgi:hypothetical protein